MVAIDLTKQDPNSPWKTFNPPGPHPKKGKQGLRKDRHKDKHAWKDPQRDAFVQSFLPLTPGIVSQARVRSCELSCQPPGAAVCPLSRVGGGKNGCQGERSLDGREADQGKVCRPDRFLQPIDFGSPFAELISGSSGSPVHSAAPGKNEAEPL